MDTIQTLDPSTISHVFSLWPATYPRHFGLDQAQFVDKAMDHELLLSARFAVNPLRGEAQAFLVLKRSACGLYPGPDERTAHINCLAMSDRIHGLKLLREAIAWLSQLGFKKLVFGQDMGHFFPGVPVDCCDLIDVLKDVGFQDHGDVVDLTRDLIDYEPPPAIRARGLAGFDVLQHDEIPMLDEFLRHEFPGRWRFDALQKVKVDGPRTIVAMHGQGRIEGFAMIQSAPCQLPIGGATWNLGLGEQWGALGPIGVAKGVRGRGLGDAMLAAGLLELKGRGCRPTIIDWTGIPGFYARHGFAEVHRYRCMSLELG